MREENGFWKFIGKGRCFYVDSRFACRVSKESAGVGCRKAAVFLENGIGSDGYCAGRIPDSDENGRRDSVGGLEPTK